MANIILQVPNLSCSHCEHTVKTALEGQPGISSVEVDLRGKKVYLGYDDTVIDLDRVGEILDDEGYPVVGSEEGAEPTTKHRFIPLLGK